MKAWRQWLKNNRGFLVFLACLAVFRTAVADWNPIPTGSMRPTLLEGDVVFIDRLAYDVKLPLTNVVIARLADPKRGDIVTFNSPKDGMRLIKRIVAVPGDVVAMKNDVLLINGRPATYADPKPALEHIGVGIPVEALRATERIDGSRRRVQFLPGIEAARNFGPVVVPPSRYFMLGDNRDNSADSRYIGLVPRHLIIGKAERILVSADILGHWRLRVHRTLSRLM